MSVLKRDVTISDCPHLAKKVHEKAVADVVVGDVREGFLQHPHLHILHHQNLPPPNTECHVQRFSEFGTNKTVKAIELGICKTVKS